MAGVAIETASAATDLALDDRETDVASGAVRLKWYFRTIERHQRRWLVSAQPHEQAPERDETSAPTEDVVRSGKVAVREDQRDTP